jgi:anthranilate synthase component 1
VRLQADLASGAITLSCARHDLSELEAAVRDLQSLERLPKGRPIADLPLPQLKEEPPQRYLGAIDAAKRYITAGDIYQANLSRLWRGAWAAAVAESGGLAQLYRALRVANPGPFAALFQQGGMAVLSSSPERLLRVRGRQLSTRPIAGTRPRLGRSETATPGLTPNVVAETAALVSHPKERAEHIMLIDLERNDLGRVAVAGSVVVDEFMVTETYAHVHHIVSNVSAELRPELTPLDALAALFPGGTITGVPKYRCMQIIAELEGVGRGAYTGSVGYLGVDGSMDVNILIRSMVYSSGELRLRAGGGIVADSDPQRELQETRAKARGMLRALGMES